MWIVDITPIYAEKKWITCGFMGKSVKLYTKNKNKQWKTK